MHWAPKRSEPARMSSGSRTAAEFRETLSAPGVEHSADVFDGAYAAADGQGNENLFRRSPDHVVHACPVVAGRRDIKEDKFVGALPVVFLCGFDGVSRVDPGSQS